MTDESIRDGGEKNLEFEGLVELHGGKIRRNALECIVILIC
jgi:hypothetical protein